MAYTGDSGGPSGSGSCASRAWMIGGGIGTLAAAALMIRDGGVPGGNITILEAGTLMGGSLDGCGDPEAGYSLHRGFTLTFDDYKRHLGSVSYHPSFSDRSAPSALYEVIASNVL